MLSQWTEVLSVGTLRQAAIAGGFDVREVGGMLDRIAQDLQGDMIEALVGPIRRQGPGDELPPIDAARLAELQIGEFVRELSKRQLVNLREILAILFEQGPEPDILAAIQQTTGLTKFQTRAVENFRLRQLGIGQPPDVAAFRTKAYAKRLLSRRANLIARHESVTLANRIVEDRARAAGGMLKQWVSARDGGVEDICLSLDNGRRIPIGDSFVGLITVGRPPAHIGCRCILEILKATVLTLSRSRIFVPSSYRRAA